VCLGYQLLCGAAKLHAFTFLSMQNVLLVYKGGRHMKLVILYVTMWFSVSCRVAICIILVCI
jgi:hypothetical protein